VCVPGHASAQQVAGRAPLGRRDRGLREHPAAQQDGDCLGVDRVVFGLTAMHGLHGEGMPEDTRDPVCSTEVRTPVPGEQAFGRQDDLSAGGRDGLAQRLWGGGHVPVQPRCTGLVEDAQVHGAGVESDTTVQRVRLGVASPCGLLRVRYEGFCHSQQTTAVCGGGGLNKYQGPGADCLQRPLLRRSRFQQQLRLGVRLHELGLPQRMKTDRQAASSLTAGFSSSWITQPGRRA
jgi:hypothetical protein